jgi:mono/diheme cytochrome c family protein
MSKKLVAIFAFVCLAVSVFASRVAAQDKPKDTKDAAPAEFKIPPEDAKKSNPLKNDAGTIAEGKKLYSSQCALCHGNNGDGKGDLAGDMKLTMHDYHDPASLKDKSDGDLFYILSKGKGDMPGEGDRLSETQRWQLIAYVRSLAGKAAPATAQTAKDEKKPQ